MSIRLFSVDIQKLFVLLGGAGNLLFPWGFIASLLTIFIGSVITIKNHLSFVADVNHALSELSSGINALLYFGLIFVSFALHEVAHGMVASRYGRLPKKFEFALYLGVLPILYLKIGGLYTLSAARRIRVWSAGIFWNITFASLILMARYSFPLAEPYGATLMKVVLANFSIAIVNLFPFLPTDGYFILSTILKRFNVRTHAWREFGNWICFRRHQFSGFLVIYFIFTVGILALILHRDFAWIREMRNIRSPGDGFRLFLVLLAPALLMVNLLRRLVRSK